MDSRPKRTAFTSTQASQAVASVNYTPNIARTGYEVIIAHRTSELYSKVAKEDGTVTALKDDLLTVTYKDGSVDTYPLGLAIGEASGEYHRHQRITDLKVGESFFKGDVIGWDEMWFARDIFNPGQVAWKAGRMVRIALLENQDTYEDSIAISKEIAQETITPYIKEKRFVVSVDQNIDFKVKEGDEVDYDQILCDVEDNYLVEGMSDEALIGEVNRLGIKQVRSSHHGKVIRIEVIYNADKESMSDSVRKSIQQLDKARARRADTEGSPVKTGAVSTMLNVNKPVLGIGKAMFTITIEAMDPSVSADKYVIGNQMKGTVGNIMERPIKTRDGRVVDVKMSFKGMFNRMVLSLRDKMAVNELCIKLTELAIKAYRGTN